MAVKNVQKKSLNSVVIVSQHDDAVDSEKSNWEMYRKTGDISHLQFIPNQIPTRFLCNFELSGKQSMSVKNGMLADRDEEGNPQVTLGTWAHRVVKHTLKDIQNPDTLPEPERIVFKKDQNGLVHDDLLGQLDRFGIVDEIFGFYTRLAVSSARDAAKN